MNSSPEKSGLLFYIFGFLCLGSGILAFIMNANASVMGENTLPWGIGKGILACMFFIALGSIINRLERIAHHLENKDQK